jgi:phosphatidate cytidylyltransferase
MLLRFLSGGIALALIAPILFYGGQLGAEALVGAVLLIVLREYSAVASPEHPKAAWLILTVVGAGVYALATWGPSDFLAAGVVLGVAVLLVWAMLIHDDPIEGAMSGALAALVVPYLAIAMAFIGKVRALDEGLYWLCLVLVCTWAADTGAYFAGRFFGSRKLCERISPKKTWEGVWGGMLLTVVVTVALTRLGYPTISWQHAIALGVILSTVSVVGDLVESMFKRARSIKDSGGIMPGHGGLFDRVDSILFTMPAAWTYVWVFDLA